jgi:hypothetical protein
VGLARGPSTGSADMSTKTQIIDTLRQHVDAVDMPPAWNGNTPFSAQMAQRIAVLASADDGRRTATNSLFAPDSCKLRLTARLR